MKRVIIESPYAGDVEYHMQYLRACLRDSLSRGEAPFASHALYTMQDVLDDTSPLERQQGIEAGFAWGEVADLVAVYQDLKISRGMELGMLRAVKAGQPIDFRSIPMWGRRK